MSKISTVYCYFAYDEDWYALIQSIRALRGLAHNKNNRSTYKVVVANDSQHPIPEEVHHLIDADEIITTTFNRGGNLVGRDALIGCLETFQYCLDKYNAEYVCKIDSDAVLLTDYYTSKTGYKLSGWSWGGYKPIQPDEIENFSLHGAFYKMHKDLPKDILEWVTVRTEEEIIEQTKCRWRIQEDYQIGEISKLIYPEEQLNIEHCKSGTDNCIFTYATNNLSKRNVITFDKYCAMLTFDYKICVTADKMDRFFSKKTTYHRMKEFVTYKLRQKYEPNSNKLDIVFVIPTFEFDSYSLQECLRSIITNFQLYKYRIVVLDDNNRPLPQEVIDKIKLVADYRKPTFDRRCNLNGMEYCISTLELYKELFTTYKPDILIKTDSDCIIRDSACLELMDDPNAVLGGFRRRDDLRDKDFCVFGAWMMFRERCLEQAIDNLRNMSSIEDVPARVLDHMGEDFTISWAIHHSFPKDVRYYDCDHIRRNEHPDWRYRHKMGMIAFPWQPTFASSITAINMFNNYEVVHYGNPIKFKKKITAVDKDGTKTEDLADANLDYRKRRILIAYKMREYNDLCEYNKW